MMWAKHALVIAAVLIGGCATMPSGSRPRRAEPSRGVAQAAAPLSLVGRAAPDFQAAAVTVDNELADVRLGDSRGRYVFLVFYPGDFTFVCPTELIAFNERLAEFTSRDCQVLSVSVDSAHTHLAWKLTAPARGGIGDIRYPMVSDLSKRISRNYGVLLGEEVALRAWFLIDRQGVVRHQLVNDLSLGRSVDEALRILDAVRYVDENPAAACPADWEEGGEALTPTREGVIEFLSE